MTIKTNKFEEFLSESFFDGLKHRELRLSDEEVKYIQREYPKSILKRIQTNQYLDGKTWYNVKLISDKPNL
ncbi:MAG: hypothetical protein SCK28_00040 [Bacillota bacterium]|nr:hypothetical protein [Bacillota bacterium]